MAITVTYDCNHELITICGLETILAKTYTLDLSTTAKCCSGEDPITYYSPEYCKDIDVKIVRLVTFGGYTYSPDYSITNCTGSFTYHWNTLFYTAYLPIVSVTGTITANDYVNPPVVTNVTNVNQLSGDITVFLGGFGASYYEFDLVFVTESGCEVNTTFSFTNIDGEAQCLVTFPIMVDPIVNTINTAVEPGPNWVVNGECIDIAVALEDGINTIDITTNEGNDFSGCIFVDCDNLLCDITKKIADNILCTNCDVNLDESFELYLEYQMLLSLINCEKCCQACQLYNKIDNELSKCSSC